MYKLILKLWNGVSRVYSIRKIFKKYNLCADISILNITKCVPISSLEGWMSKYHDGQGAQIVQCLLIFLFK